MGAVGAPLHGLPHRQRQEARYRKPPTLFDATAYGTPQMWLRADDLLSQAADVTSLQTVSSWTDRSAAGNSMTAITASRYNAILVQRAWKGLAGVYVATPNAPLNSNALVTGATARTMVSVLLVNTVLSGAINGVYGYGTNTSGNAWGLSINNASGLFMAHSGATAHSNASVGPRLTRPDVLIQVYTGSNHVLYMNGSQIANAAVALNTGSTIAHRIGGNTNYANFAGLIFEMAFYAVDLTASVAAITAQLQAQYRTEE